MKFLSSAMIVVLGLSGCAQKGTFDLFKMDKAHKRSVEQLRTGTIMNSMETNALVSLMYLNPIYPETYNDGEYFVGAFYFKRSDRDIKKWNLADRGYTLKLNGKDSTSMEELKESDPRRMLIPIQNNWNQYYLIRFDPSPVKTLTLLLENNQTGSVALSYQKEK